MKKKLLYSIMTLGGGIGFIAAFLQMIEKVQLLKNANQALSCDLNSVFSCSAVLDAWQSSLFGFPNSLLCMTFFTIFTVIGIAGLSGSTLTKGLRLGVQGLALFVLAFALWFLWQSIYAIEAVCALCLVCLIGLLFVNGSWLRMNVDDLPASIRPKLKQAIAGNYDILGWILIGILVALAIIFKFYLV